MPKKSILSLCDDLFCWSQNQSMNRHSGIELFSLCWLSWGKKTRTHQSFFQRIQMKQLTNSDISTDWRSATLIIIHLLDLCLFDCGQTFSFAFCFLTDRILNTKKELKCRHLSIWLIFRRRLRLFRRHGWENLRRLSFSRSKTETSQLKTIFFSFFVERIFPSWRRTD